MNMQFGPRRSQAINITDELKNYSFPDSEIKTLEKFDLIYRTVCAMMYNYVPMSGHPGGSISSGRFVAALLFHTMNYDFSDPDRADADIISYAAGHKALGLYGLWAMRNEVARIGDPSLLPRDEKLQLRLEDLLGFRRNPTNDTPLFLEKKSKPLDGHPTPATPFVKLSTGASGIGMTTSAGLAMGALDYYEKPPFVHIVEGEGGMTPGRVQEMLSACGTAGISNCVLHVDWNQASIDSNHVCREGNKPGDYVQWDPIEFLYLNDWNVIVVQDGLDFRQILAAQKKAVEINNGQPTAIVYKTIKGWKYGIEGRASHGAGHKFCSDNYYESLKPFEKEFGISVPCFIGNSTPAEVEQSYWDSLLFIRKAIESSGIAKLLSASLKQAKENLDRAGRKPRAKAPNIDAIYDSIGADKAPDELQLKIGSSVTLRGQLGNVLGYLNRQGQGAMIAAAADLLGSTSVTNVDKGFDEGFYHHKNNPGSRLVAVGGICEDAICGFMAGLSTYGRHIGVGSSYGAFIAALGHVASRLHCIGNQARKEIHPNEKYKPYFMICAHAGLKTGEDGPTHADPQALQLLMENFPAGTMITLTPWSPDEIWTLVTAALQKRPCVIAPFVTRPNETVLDRKALNLAPATDSKTGVYALRRYDKADGALVLHGSGVANVFLTEALPKLDSDGRKLNIYYVASAELFDELTQSEQEKIFPISDRNRAMGITGFTLPTLYRWILSEKGRSASLYPFKLGHYLGSGKAEAVMAQAKLDGLDQYEAVKRYLNEQ